MKYLILGVCLFCAALFTHSQNQLDTVRVDGELFYMPQNAFKIDVLRFISGDVIFSYERAFGFNNGVEFEIGPTISMMGLNRMRFLGISKNIPYFNVVESDRAEESYGFLFSVAYKKYLFNEYPAFNGLYIAPRLKFRNYNNLSKFTLYNPDLTQRYKDKLYQGLLTFELGMNHYFKSKFGLEYYMFMGLTLNKFKYHHYIESYDGNTDTWSEEVSLEKITFFNPNFGFGLKLYIGM